jgi:serine/threonine protein kinase
MSRLERYVGEVLDHKYRLERLLGQGGMGAVYLATHLGTERYVALKLITPQFMRNEEFVERFKREARAAGRLRHPNVVDVTDFGFAPVGTERVAYLVMEYLDGCTLGDVLAEEKTLTLEWTVDILEQVCSAVHEAHAQGIVHRDLKPDNIWLEPNRVGSYRVKVLDFGIAKLAGPPGAPALAGVMSETDAAHMNASTGMSRTPLLNVGARVGKPLGSDPDSETLIFSPGVSADQGDAGLAQNFAGAAAEGGDGHGAQGSRPTLIGNHSDSTQLFDLPVPAGQSSAEGPQGKELTAMAQGARATQIIEDGDKTLRLGQETELRVIGQHTVLPAGTAEGAGLTRVGAIMGTPTYMSPEQCRSAHLDARSDIYSIGVIAYQMLAGEPPFKGDTSTVMRGHLESKPLSLRERTGKVPKRAAGVVMAALAKDPAERPQTAQAFANSLRAQADGIGSMYRRAFALYSEHFPKFLRLSLIAHLPAIACTLALIVLTLSEDSLSSRGKAAKILTLSVIGLVALLQILSHYLAASVISGVTAVIVTQLSVAPLRPVELRPAFAVLKKRWRPFLNTSIRLAIRITIGYCLLIIPGLVMSVRYALWAPVVLMEGLSKKAARKRARELASRSWRTVIIVLLLQVLIPVTAGILMGRLSVEKDDPDAASQTAAPATPANPAQANAAKPPAAAPATTAPPSQANPASQTAAVGKTTNPGQATKKHTKVKFTRTVAQQLSGLINILIVPLMSIVPALLYLKMRQLGGETMTTALEQIEEVETERSQWQKRMRSRLTVTPASGQTGPPASRSNA